MKAGTLIATNANANQTGITTDNSSLASPVTFACADGEVPDSVNFASNGFNLMIRASWVTFRGSCFHVRILHVNSPGDSGAGANQVTFDGVHMDSFQLSGAHNTTIKNSQIGPALACYKPGEGTAAARCSNYAKFPSTWQDVARWWASSSGGGTTGEQLEPYVHDRGNGSDKSQCTQGVLLQGDTFRDLQSTDSAVMHQGGLLIDGGACQRAGLSRTLTIERSTFLHNMTYSIEMDGPMSGSTIQNNWIGTGYKSLGNGGIITGSQDAAVDVPDSLESGCRKGAHTVANMLIRYNSADGYIAVNGNFDSSASCWSNVRVIANIFKNGAGSCTATALVTYAYNVVNGSAACGSSSQAIASLPFVRSAASSLDYRLTGSPPVQTVPQTAGPDYALSTDYFGNPRSSVTKAGAVGP